MQVRAYTAASPDTLRKGQYVLYRDPDLHYRGEESTFLCRVVAFAPRFYVLADVKSGREFPEARRQFIRPLDDAEVMRDIDLAPLAEDGAATDLPSAAMAWLRQNREHGPQAGGR